MTRSSSVTETVAATGAERPSLGEVVIPCLQKPRFVVLDQRSDASSRVETKPPERRPSPVTISVSLAVHLAFVDSLLLLFSKYGVPQPSRAGVVLPAVPLLLVVVLLLVRRAAQRKAAASKENRPIAPTSPRAALPARPAFP